MRKLGLRALHQLHLVRIQSILLISISTLSFAPNEFSGPSAFGDAIGAIFTYSSFARCGLRLEVKFSKLNRSYFKV
ncbi:hypothetical protein DFH27DRAFT_552947 [Peziza echinospora]|nr:hypothetical protein DFH27DRAFT_552947 [Peziza echinospora]